MIVYGKLCRNYAIALINLKKHKIGPADKSLLVHVVG